MENWLAFVITVIIGVAFIFSTGYLFYKDEKSKIDAGKVLLGWFIIYLLAALIQTDLNPFKWHWIARSIVAIVAFVWVLNFTNTKLNRDEKK